MKPSLRIAPRTLAVGASLLLLAACGSSPTGQPSPPPIDGSKPHPAEGSAVGSRAIDFALQDADGRTVRLSDFRGKVVLIEFSAMW